MLYNRQLLTNWIGHMFFGRYIKDRGYIPINNPDSLEYTTERCTIPKLHIVIPIYCTSFIRKWSSTVLQKMTEKHYKGGSTFPALKPNCLRLYSMRFCPYAQRTRLVLAHKNIPHETVNIHLRDKPDWFLTKNPLGAVPVLEIDDKIVYESTAACEWLDDIYPQSRLQPSDPYQRALDRILLEYFGKITSAYYGLLFKTGDQDSLAADLVKHLKFYDSQLAKRGGPFFGDKSPSLLDFYIWPHLERVQALGTRDNRIFVDKARYPKLAEWFESMSKVPAVKATSDDTKTLLHFSDSAVAGSPDFDYGLQ